MLYMWCVYRNNGTSSNGNTPDTSLLWCSKATNDMGLGNFSFTVSHGTIRYGVSEQYMEEGDESEGVHLQHVGPCSVVGHVPILPWVRSRVWVRVGLWSGKGWVGRWPVTKLDPTWYLYIHFNSVSTALHSARFLSKSFTFYTIHTARYNTFSSCIFHVATNTPMLRSGTYLSISWLRKLLFLARAACALTRGRREDWDSCENWLV